MAQLGALAVWKNYIADKPTALAQYKAALSLGYTKTIDDIYKTAGIEFNFSAPYIKQLMEFVKVELNKCKY
jgi:oligoendopeptidase F